MGLSNFQLANEPSQLIQDRIINNEFELRKCELHGIAAKGDYTNNGESYGKENRSSSGKWDCIATHPFGNWQRCRGSEALSVDLARLCK